jgi:hypothetical protein
MEFGGDQRCHVHPVDHQVADVAGAGRVDGFGTPKIVEVNVGPSCGLARPV